METKFSRFISGSLGICLLCGAVVLNSGCRSLRVTEPPRTAIEQLLLSTADDDAMKGFNLLPLKGKKIYVEEKYFESYDKGYALGNIRELLCRNGCRLVEKREEADTIVE